VEPGCVWPSGCGRRCWPRRWNRSRVRAWTPAGVALGEILALRSLLLNLHFRAAKGEPVAESEMRGLIERADGVKMQRARERLAAVRAESKTDEETEPEEASAAHSTLLSSNRSVISRVKSTKNFSTRAFLATRIGRRSSGQIHGFSTTPRTPPTER